VEFEWFGPFYAANPEHLGQQSPADVLTMLRRTPDEVARVLDGRADLATRPGPDEWSIAELVRYLIETDSAFRSRVHDRARQQRRTGARLPPAVDLARRQGLGTHVGGRAPVCVPRYPGRDDCARRGPHRHHTDTDWMRKGTVRGTANSGSIPQSRHATSSRTPRILANVPCRVLQLHSYSSNSSAAY
jgi:hypothetical protein